MAENKLDLRNALEVRKLNKDPTSEDLSDTEGLPEVEMKDEELRQYMEGMIARMTFPQIDTLKKGYRNGFPLAIDVPVIWDFKQEAFVAVNKIDAINVLNSLVGLGLLKVSSFKREGQVQHYEFIPGMLFNVFVKTLNGEKY